MTVRKRVEKPEGDNVVQLMPKGKKANPDRLKQEVLDHIGKLKTAEGKSAIAEILGEDRLKELVDERGYKDMMEITDNIHAIWSWLHEFNFDYIIDRQFLTKETLEKLYTSLPYKSEQINYGLYYLCGRGADFAGVAERFFKAAMDNLDKRIFWRPMVEELMEYDELGALSYFLNGSYEEYLQKWDESVALLAELVEQVGSGRDFVVYMSGNRNATLEDGSGFCTDTTGRIYATSYSNLFGTHAENLTSLKMSVVHECGHHKWKSFRINLHEDALRLDIVGARFARQTTCPNTGRKVYVIAVKKDGVEEAVKVKTYRDLMKIVRYPKLLAWLHNVADDKRIDALNIAGYPGYSDEYVRNQEKLLEKRAELKGGELGDLLEGLLQQTVCGRTRNEPNEELRGKLEQVAKDLAEMEIREDTDGTDSLNVALRWYVTIEPELDALAARIEMDEGDGDVNEELAKLLPENFSGSDTSIDSEDNNVQMTDDAPGPIRISKKKKGPRFGKWERRMDPFSFLDLPGQKGEGQDGDSEPGDDYSDGESTPGNGDVGDKPGQGKKNDDPTAGEEGSGGKGGKKGKTYRYDEWTGHGYRPGTKPVTEHFSDEGKLVRPPPYLVKRVKRMFQKYAPKTGVLVRGLESGYPDPVLLEQYIEAIDAGQVPRPEYFANVVHERSNVVVTVNIDFSSSMSTPVNGRSRIDIAVESGAVLASAAEVMRYPIEATGFTGGDVVDFHLLKVTKNGIIMPNVHLNATPMAGAVRHATQRTLALRKASRKRFAYQFWITDGEPNCSGEGIDAIVDTGRAIEEAKAKRIKTLGIVIADANEKAHMEETYQNVFGRGRYVVVTSAERLVNPLLKFMRRIAINFR